LWLTALVQGRSMDEHTRVVDAKWHAAQLKSGQQGSESQASGEPRSGQDG